MKKLLVGVVVGAFMFSQIMADDITDTIENALKYYKNKQYSEAKAELNFAIQQLNVKTMEELKKYFPKALPDWKEKKVEGAALSSNAFGGGVTVSKRYIKKDNTDTQVEITLLTDSPLATSMMTMLSNPFMMVTTPDQKVIRIKGKKATLEWDEESKNGTINVLLKNKVIVQITGNNITSIDIVKKYANKVDYKKLEEYTENN